MPRRLRSVTMPAKKKEFVGRSDEQILPLTDVISSLDSIRAYRRRSSRDIDEKFRKLGGMGYPEARKIWNQVEDDIDRIVDMPMQIPAVPSMIRLTYMLRLMGRMFLILLVVVIAARFVKAWQSSLGELLGDNMWFLIFVVVGSLVGINGEMVVDFMIRRKIIKYEKSSEEKYRKNVDAVKKATQGLIDRLAKELERSQKDRADFSFQLFFDDYDGIEVVSSKTPRSLFVFKRDFKVFKAVVK